MKKYSLIIIFLFSFIMGTLDSAYAKSVMWTKNENNSLFYFADRWGCCGWTKGLGSRMITIKYNAEVINLSKNSEVVGGSSEVAVGSKLRFIFKPHQSEDIYWFGTGYTQDSPYGDWIKDAAKKTLTCDEKDLVQSGVYSYEVGPGVTGPYDIYIPLSVNIPESKTLTDTMGMSCGPRQGDDLNGYYYDCIMNSLGVFYPKFNIGPTYGKFYYKYWDYRNYGKSYKAGCYNTDYPMSSVDGGDIPSRGSTYILQVPGQSINYTIKVRNTFPPSRVTINGPTQGYINKSYNFSLNATHPDGSDIQYGLDWNMDGIVDTLVSPSGSSGSKIANVSNTFNVLGRNTFQALAIDKYGSKSPWTTHRIDIFPLPIITKLSLNPSYADNNSQSDITWSVLNVSSCLTIGEWNGTVVDIRPGEHSMSTGIKTITVPNKIFYYTLKCFGVLGGTEVYDIKTAEFFIKSDMPAVELIANPSYITVENSSSTLSWKSQNIDPNSCSKYMVSTPPDPVWMSSPNYNLPISGFDKTQIFTNNGLYEYGISCTANGINVLATTSVKVEVYSLDLRLVAEPNNIFRSNSSSTLMWKSAYNVDNSCIKSMVSGIDNTWSGAYHPTSGSQSTKIYDKNGDYTYEIRCFAKSTTWMRSTTTVKVDIPQPIVSLVSNPMFVGRTSSSTLTWLSENTTDNSCVKSMVKGIDNSWFGNNKPTSGSQSTKKYGTSLKSSSHDGEYIYKITCSGPAGIASSTATVIVSDYLKPSVVITGPDSVYSGVSPDITWRAENSSFCVKTLGSGTWAGDVKDITKSPYEMIETPGYIDKTTTYVIECFGKNGDTTGKVSKVVNVGECVQDNWTCSGWSPNACIAGQTQSRLCDNSPINKCPSITTEKPEVIRICPNIVTTFQPLCQAYQNFGSGYREVSTGTIYVNRDMEWVASNIPAGSYYMTNNFGDSKEVTVYDKLVFYKLYQNPGIKNFSISLESIDGTSKGDCSTTTNAINQNQVIIEE